MSAQFQKRQRVYMVTRYGAGLEKRRYGKVQKVGNRGVLVRFDDGHEMWCSRDTYPEAPTPTDGTKNTENDSGDGDSNQEDTVKTKSKQLEDLSKGTRVSFRQGSKTYEGVVHSTTANVVAVVTDNGTKWYPRRSEVSVVAPATPAEASDAARAPTVPATPSAPAASSATEGLAAPSLRDRLRVVPNPAPAPSPAPSGATSGAPSGSVAGPRPVSSTTGTMDWVGQLAAAAAGLLNEADASVQAAQAEAAKATRAYEEACLAVDKAVAAKNKAEQERAAKRQHAVEVAEKRDALLRLVQGGKAAS